MKQPFSYSFYCKKCGHYEFEQNKDQIKVSKKNHNKLSKKGLKCPMTQMPNGIWIRTQIADWARTQKEYQ
ncbi:MAG: hypothetical protein ACTSYH_03690 [Candidatus Heimdallarchaeaceae archaeon]